MKISKIYSNKQFKNIEFSFGLNVIIGKIIDPNKNENDTHNLGKSRLIEIIDYLLLKEISNKNKFFLTRNKEFQGQIFFGEFLLNNNDYLIIRRTVDENTKISFKINKYRLNNFQLNITEWDNENLPIDKAKGILNQYLQFDILKNWNYRKSLSYFIRNQNDFIDVFKLGKFQGVHKDWKPMVFDLLKFDGDLLKSKYEIEDRIEECRNLINTLKNEQKVDTSKRDKLVGFIEIKKDEKQKLEQLIDKFNFYKNDNEYKNKIVEELDTQINSLNAQHYNVKYEIKKINVALETTPDHINVNELKELFQQVNVYFPNNLVKEYNQLVEFNTQITSERSRFLLENLNELNNENKKIESDLQKLEKDKSELISLLIEKDSYYKFKEYQKGLSKIEADILLLDEKLSIIDVIVSHEKILDENIEKQKHKIQEINNELAKQNHSLIRKLFNEIVYELLNVPAIISVSQNQEGNIEFEADYQNPLNLTITDKSRGSTYKKILCTAFDIALLKYYNKNSYYRFVYHDGILDGLDIRIKKKHIALIRELVKTYNIQYIFTVIESELYDIKGKIEFIEEEICLELSDKSDKDKLFEIEF